MPRRAKVTRVIGDRTGQAMSFEGSDSVFSIRPTFNQSSNLAANTEIDHVRIARLEAYTPKGLSPEVWEAVKPKVMELVAQVQFVSVPADRAQLCTLYAFAGWCHHRYGRFEPDLHLVDREIRAFTETALGHMAVSGRATYGSTLRRLARGGHVQYAGVRRASMAPHSDAEMRAFWAAAGDAGRWSEDAELLLTLAGDAGLSSNEIVRARPDWIEPHFGHTVVRVPHPKGTGEFREFPVLGDAARRLRVASEAGGPWLFRPTFKNRTNAISHHKIRMAVRHKVYRTFSATRARNHWICRHLQSGLPFSIVCGMAGIRPGNHLPTDLLEHLHYPTLHDMLRHVRATMHDTRATR